LLTCRELDGSTSAAKAFDRLFADTESELGGSDRLSVIERAFVEGFPDGRTMRPRHSMD